MLVSCLPRASCPRLVESAASVLGALCYYDSLQARVSVLLSLLFGFLNPVLHAWLIFFVINYICWSGHRTLVQAPVPWCSLCDRPPLYAAALTSNVAPNTVGQPVLPPSCGDNNIR